MKRVSVAILCCFIIAFLIQGVLKLSGVFVFEKALDWDIFKIIDDHLWLTIIYYSILMSITMYCLSFTLRRKPYSKYWWHYVIMVSISFSMITLQYLSNIILDTRLSIMFDILLYVIVPLIIYFTTPRQDRIFTRHSVTNIAIIVMIQILLYFLYLGLNYWSGILNSIIPVDLYNVSASALFLIQQEVYIGLAMLMLSMNILINKFIKEDITNV